MSLDTLRYYERERLIGPIERTSGRRRYTEDDVAWIGIVTCLRDAGLGIGDLRRFTQLLRSEAGSQDRVAFLTRRREELHERLRLTQAALNVLDDKINYYGQPCPTRHRGRLIPTEGLTLQPIPQEDPLTGHSPLPLSDGRERLQRLLADSRNGRR